LLASHKLLRLIPNSLTLGNAIFGFLAMQVGSIPLGLGCLIFAAICDGLDGFAARKLGVDNVFGTSLDIVADVVSFAVSPAYVIYHTTHPIFALVYLCCALWRLAVFANVASQPYWIGLPSLVAALVVWVSAAVIPWLLPFIAVIVSMAMVDNFKVPKFR
jgi:CDP-diacylglycerol---serine O-phosphatidyltransferase